MASSDHNRTHDKWMDYNIERFISRGGNGFVYAATRKSDGKAVALKYINSKTLATYTLFPGLEVPREVYWLIRVGPINICIKMVEHFKRNEGHVVVMERPTSSVDLWQYATKEHVDGIPEVEARILFRQCVVTVGELYKAGIVHMDLKPDNLLLDRHLMEVKIIDFGCAEMVQEQSFTEWHGTELFKPPEYHLTKSFDGLSFTVWSLGVTLYHIIHGHLPFETDEEIMEAKPDVHETVSDQLTDLIKAMLNPEPSKRPDFDKILSHPWMQPTIRDEVVNALATKL